MTMPIISLATVPRRASSVERAIEALRSVADVRVHRAPADDPGPIWKWIAPQDVSADHVVVCDDDWIYTPDWLAAIVDALDRHGPGTAVQGSSARMRLRADGVPVSGRVQFEDVTDIAQAYAGLGLHAADFVNLRAALRVEVLSATARLADDYVVSRAMRRMGLRVVALPRPDPVPTETMHQPGALHTIPPGHFRRYRTLARAESSRWWASA